MFDWLSQPIDISRVHEVGALLSWHGRAMLGAWTVCVPLGIIAARYFKIFPGQDWPAKLDDHRWWNSHRIAQYLALALMLAGLALILPVAKPVPSANAGAGLHHLLGWTTLVLGALQYLAAWLRGTKGGPTAPALDGSLRGDHYDMTLRRRIFERLHKSVGYAALLISAAAVTTGLWQANGPRWMFLAIGLWYLTIVAAFAVLQKAGMTQDTYQAIWGPDPVHPGNTIRPIGIGIRRPPSTG